MVGARTADDMVECARPSPLYGNLSSIVFEPRQLQLPEERAPHVLINCPENSGCTMFAFLLCVLIDATACRPDTAGRYCNDHSPRLWKVPANVSYVHKSVITGYRRLRERAAVRGRRGGTRRAGASAGALRCAREEPSPEDRVTIPFNHSHHRVVYRAGLVSR